VTYAKLLSTAVNNIQTAFELLHSVVRIPDNPYEGTIMTYHASFPDYLTTHASSQLWSVDIYTAHAHTATLCLDLLDLELCIGISGIVTSYYSNKDQFGPLATPPLVYACIAWGDHILLSTGLYDTISMDFLTRINSFLQNKFLYWLEELSVLQDVELASMLLHQLFQRIPSIHLLKKILGYFLTFTTTICSFSDELRPSPTPDFVLRTFLHRISDH